VESRGLGAEKGEKREKGRGRLYLSSRASWGKRKNLRLILVRRVRRMEEKGGREKRGTNSPHTSYPQLKRKRGRDKGTSSILPFINSDRGKGGEGRGGEKGDPSSPITFFIWAEENKRELLSYLLIDRRSVIERKEGEIGKDR